LTLPVGNKSKLSFRDPATSSAASLVEKIVQFKNRILIESEDLTNSDKSFQTDGEAKLNAGCEAFN